MSNHIIRNSLGALAAVATLTLGGIANAAVYSSHFDPFGALSFVGNGLFQLDDACLLTDGFYTGAECNVSLLSATVDLTSTGPDGTGHLDFAPLLPSTDIADITISGNELVGVDSGLIGSVFPSPCTAGVFCGTPWWLQWGMVESDPVFLYAGACTLNSDEVLDCVADTRPSATAFNVTFTRVPEPGTLGLLFAAIGAGALMRRRKIVS